MFIYGHVPASSVNPLKPASWRSFQSPGALFHNHICGPNGPQWERIPSPPMCQIHATHRNRQYLRPIQSTPSPELFPENADFRQQLRECEIIQPAPVDASCPTCRRTRTPLRTLNPCFCRAKPAKPRNGAIRSRPTASNSPVSRRFFTRQPATRLDSLSYVPGLPTHTMFHVKHPAPQSRRPRSVKNPAQSET